ncbi:MAG: hypothetical protein ACRCUY_07000 [Thermoguttaceae bacterium]
MRDTLGIKASPASHVGAGSAKSQLNGLIQSTEKGKELNDLIKTETISEQIVHVALPTRDKHAFAVALMENVELDYLKKCVQYLSESMMGVR